MGVLLEGKRSWRNRFRWLPLIMAGMKKALPLFLLALLASCGTGKAMSFDSTKPFDATRPTLFQNGDLLYAEDPGQTYLDVAHRTNGNELVNSLGSGEDSLLLFAAGDCSHCQRLEPTFAKVIAYSRYEVKLLYAPARDAANLSPIRGAIARVKADYPNHFQEPLAFPTSYILNKDSSTYFDYAGQLDDAAKLLDFLQGKVNRGEIYRFHDPAHFRSFLQREKVPGLVYGNATATAIPTRVYQQAIQSKRKLALLDVNYLEEKDKAAYAEDGLHFTTASGAADFAPMTAAGGLLDGYYRSGEISDWE